MDSLVQRIINIVATIFIAAMVLLPAALYISELRLKGHIAESGGDIDSRLLKQGLLDIQRAQLRDSARITEHCVMIHEIQDKLGIKHRGMGAELRIYEREQVKK